VGRPLGDAIAALALTAACSTAPRELPAPARAAPSASAPGTPSGSAASAHAAGSGAHAAGSALSAAVLPRRSTQPGTDVTFYAISDLHFGEGWPATPPTGNPIAKPVGLEVRNLQLIRRLNGFARTAYPGRNAGRVERPRGVLAAGDLTEWSRPLEWQRFAAMYGATGREGELKLPIYEVAGNHDRIAGPHIEEHIAERHGGRFYAWDWDDVHLVALGEAPDEEGLAFLKHDLARLAPDVPIVLMLHLALAGPFSDGWFASSGLRERFADLIAGHHVIAILHGHHHAGGRYRWRGFDVFKVGAVKDGPTFFTVLHVTDDRLRVAVYDYGDGKWVDRFEKSIAR
jgi:3',5'-cyclic AMP phosphodiesterase CpdA